MTDANLLENDSKTTKHPFDNTRDFFTPDDGTHYFNIQHREIIDRLQYFVKNNQIPNIIFYGDNCCGKKTILKYFINQIYRNEPNIKDNILSINCCHGKGNIKFIREELKLFANSIIINNSGSNIKSVILLNADSLTIDAQSSLRRLIEINNKSTRFFIVVNNYERLLKPIISRFCSIYFNQPLLNGKPSNYNNILYNNVYNNISKKKGYDKDLHIINAVNLEQDKNKNKNNQLVLKRIINTYMKSILINSDIKVFEISDKLYQRGFSSLDLLKYIECQKIEKPDEKPDKKPDENLELGRYKILSLFDTLTKEIRNERLIMYFLLNYIFFRYNFDIKKFI